MKKEKAMRRLEITALIVILAALVGWFSYLVYRNIQSKYAAANVNVTEMHLAGWDSYINNLDALINGEDAEGDMDVTIEEAEDESAASTSEETAATSEETAATSEETAATSEENAATSEETAATSEEAAATSEEAAATSEEAAATSEETSATSEEAAAASEVTGESAADK